MKKRDKVIAIIIMLAFILPNVYIISKGQESYPYTPAPMFGHYIGKNTRFYDIKFIAKGRESEKEVLPIHKEHDNQLAISRFFFDKIYGSVEPNTPLGDFRDETKEKFEKRMAHFCSIYFGYLKNDKENHYDRLQLVVNQYNRDYDLLGTHLVGYYDLSGNQFVHTWK